MDRKNRPFLLSNSSHPSQITLVCTALNFIKKNDQFSSGNQKIKEKLCEMTMSKKIMLMDFSNCFQYNN